MNIDKLRKEITNSLKKDEILNKEDKILFKNFYNKISSEVKNVD